MKKNRYKYIISLTLLLVLWNTSAWIIAKHFYVSRVRSVVNEEKALTQKRALDLADGFQRHLSFVSGIPDLLVHSDRIQRVVTRFAPSRIRSPLTIEARKKLWGADAELSAVSGYLQLARINLHVDQIYIVNAAGDCIASSIPFNSPESPTGSNFSERSIFASNREGQRAVQYAVGKTTHIPGLFFSTPIVIEGQFSGAVVVKIDVPNLAFITNLANAFVTDSHGVVILASKKTFEMRAMPDGAIAKMPVDKQIERYQASNFSTLNIEPWSLDKSYALMRLDSSNIPSVLMSKSVPGYGITVYVDTEFPHLNAMDRDNFWFAFLLGLSGSILILMGYGALQYVASNKAARAQLWQQAHFDLLTALPNRSLFHDRLDQEIKKSNRTDQPLALLMIDLDNFKEINDMLGHPGGDHVLKEIAFRIRSCIRKSDTVSRLSGDEFTVILPNLCGKSNIEDVAQKILNALAEPFKIGSESVHITASVGITKFPNDAVEAPLLIRNADQAMYLAKKEGGNRFCYYSWSMQEAAHKRQQMIHALREALEAGQFRIYFQPIVELATGRIHKAEALIRWHHPDLGMVSPVEFIPLAEETGLIHEIGDWVFYEATKWAKCWRNQFADDFQVSINKSPLQFQGKSQVNDEKWNRHLQKLGLPGRNIIIEITEGLLLNAGSENVHKLRELHDAGMQIAIDDFGTGYSSLSYLKKFDIDFLKIDRIFVQNLETNSADLALCEAIIVMAHKLGMKVIAEGVETKVQRDMLAAARCDYVQGFLFSKPIPPEEFVRHLQRDSSVFKMTSSWRDNPKIF